MMESGASNQMVSSTSTSAAAAASIHQAPSLPPSLKSSTKTFSRRKRTFKVIMVGDANVGKTCLSFRFVNGRFPENTEATIGVDFRERNLEIDGDTIKMQLWDTAGQERFRQSMVSHYYRNVHAVVFVYDVTQPKSFQSLTNWIQEFEKQQLDNAKEIPRILIGNKCDMNELCAVQTQTAQRFADTNDMPLFETSAKAQSQADHVESIFMTLVHKLVASKHMHVQSDSERNDKMNEAIALKATDTNGGAAEEAWCC